MSEQVAVAAEIRAGKREQLATRLAEGPPFDLAEHGFTGHRAFLGERTVQANTPVDLDKTLNIPRKAP